MFKLTLVTPEKKVVTGLEIEEATVPAHKGELNILPGHAPLMTTLVPGVMKYKPKGAMAQIRVSISWGYCQVSPEGINVLAETIETAEELDLDRAKKALATAEHRMMSESLDLESWEDIQASVARARARIELGTSKH